MGQLQCTLKLLFQQFCLKMQNWITKKKNKKKNKFSKILGRSEKGKQITFFRPYLKNTIFCPKIKSSKTHLYPLSNKRQKPTGSEAPYLYWEKLLPIWTPEDLIEPCYKLFSHLTLSELIWNKFHIHHQW